MPALMSREKLIQRIATVLSGLSTDKAWLVQIGEHKPSRSQQQNRYLFGVVYKTILETGQLQGWELEDIHEFLLGEFSGWETLEGFGRKRMKPIRRSSTMSKDEFSKYIDFIQRKMAGLGIFIEDADPMRATA